MNETPKKILVATDFSASADRAEQLALALARRLSAELHIVHVRVILDDPHMAEEHQLELEKLLSITDVATESALARSGAGETEISVESHLVRGISAPEVISETAVGLGCDLVVMGTHGRRGIKHFLLGSVAEAVVRSVDIPVLTVRPDAAIPTGGPGRILVPHDFSEPSAMAVRTAASWAQVFDAEVSLVHVVEPVAYPEFYNINVVSEDVLAKLRDRATEALDRAASELLGARPASTQVLIGRAADTIVSEAASGACDLVVMGTRGLSGLEHLVLGSVAEAVLRRCPVPLLTVSG
jgi:nucleotide-binding universal stress UspA family protein